MRRNAAWLKRISLLPFIFLFMPVTLHAQSQSFSDMGVEIESVFTTDPAKTNEGVVAGIGDKIRVKLKNLDKAIDDDFDPHQLVLFLDGIEVSNVFAIPIDSENGVLEFTLERNEKSKNAWATLLGSPKRSTKPVTVSVGLPGGEPLKPASPRSAPIITLRVIRGGALIGSFIAFLMIVSLFLWKGKKGNILRGPKHALMPPGTEPPFSLGRIQMAFWFFVVYGSFIFLYAITGDTNTISEQSLLLLGIGAGTALGAEAINASKRSTAESEVSNVRRRENKVAERESELSKLVEQIRRESGSSRYEIPANIEKRLNLAEERGGLAEDQSRAQRSLASLRFSSQGFFNDILYDGGIMSLHRFQLLAWTLVLGFLFAVGVYKTLAMPEFSTTLLALMGISSGTYLGFKVPEQPQVAPSSENEIEKSKKE